MNCIYCGEDTGNTKSREHVISACFGGKAKLPLGVVCDNCNQLFSKWELHVADESFLSIIRAFEGPGKRGSMNPKKAYVNSWTFGKTETGVMLLTYLSSGQPYTVPHLLLDVKEFNKTRKIKGAVQDEWQAKEFFNQAKQLNPDEIKQELDKENIAEGQMILLYDLPKHLKDHKRKCQSFQGKYFKIVRHPSITDTEVKNFFNWLKKDKFRLECQEKRREHVENKHEISHDQKIFERYICKTFINTLAHFEGESLIKNQAFTSIKNFILSGEGESPVKDGKSSLLWGALDSLGFAGDYSHHIFYKKFYNPVGIIGIVSLYRMNFMTFIPYDWKKGKDLKYDMNGLFVDFKNEKEMNFYELLKDLGAAG